MKLHSYNPLKNEKPNDGGDAGQPPASSGYQHEPETPPAAGGAPQATNAEGTGDSHDDFGYAKEPAGKQNEGGKGDNKSEPPAAAKPGEEVDPTLSGYGDEAPPAPKPPEEKPPEKPAVDLGYEVDTTDVPDADKLKTFLKDGEFTKAQADKIAARLRDDNRAYIAAQKQREADVAAETARVKKAWHQELKSSSDFGGENFSRNVKTVNKVIHDFMPETKKMLTERKGMLPPNTMRDLLKLGKHLYGTEPFAQGEPPRPEERQRTEDDDIRDMYS